MQKMSQILVFALSVAAVTLADGIEWTDAEAAGGSGAALDTFKKDPKYRHFYNGSYTVQSVLTELLNNKSLTETTKR